MPAATDQRPDENLDNTDLTPEEQEQARYDAEFSDIMSKEGMSPQNYYDNHFNQIATREHNPDTTANWDNQYNGYYDDLDASSNGALQPDALRQAETDGGATGGYTPPAAAFGKSEASMGQAAAAETNQFKYDPASGLSRGEHFRKVVFTKDPKTKRRLITGGVFGGGLTGVLISLFTLVLPLKLEATLQNLREYYFANADSVIAQRAGYLVEQYLLTSWAQINLTEGCGVVETIDRSCFVGTANTPVGALFQEWRQQKFETKLKDNYGIEMRRETSGNLVMSVRGVAAVDFGSEGLDGNSNEIRVNRSNYRRVINESLRNREVNSALERETWYKRMFYRYKVGKLLEVKYGLNRCLVACDTRKAINGKVKEIQQKNYKRFAQIALNSRVMTPRGQFAVLVFGCIVDTAGPGCNTDPASAPAPDPNADPNNPNPPPDPNNPNPPPDPAARRSALEDQVRLYAQRASLNVTPEAIEKAARVIDEIGEAGGYTEYFVKKVAFQIAGQTGERIALGSIPVIGWINTGINLLSQAGTVGTFIRYANYTQHAVTAAQVFGTWQVYSDEIKQGFGDPAITASMVGALSNGVDPDNPSDQPAEVAPVWTDIYGEPEPGSSGFNWLLPTASATGGSNAASLRYTCDDKEQIASGQKACPEERFYDDGALTKILGVFNEPPLDTIVSIASAVKGAVGSVTGFVGDILSGITSTVLESFPPYQTFMANFNSIITSMAKAVQDYLIPSAISLQSSGARLYQVLAAGANATSNTTCQLNLGCPNVSAATAYQYRREYLDQQKAIFASKPLKERLFATETSGSLINRLALAAPSSTGNLANNSVASLIASPFKTIGSSLAGLMPQKRALAEVGEDPWGIPQTAYRPGDAVIQADPGTYTKEYCAALNETWQASFTVDEKTAQQVTTVANPCLLEETVVQVVGGYSNTSLLPAGSGATQAAAPTPAADPAIPSLAPPNGSTLTRDQTSEIPGGGGYRIDTKVLPQFMAMLAAANKDGINLFPLSSGWRDPQQQIALRKRNCPDWQNSPPRDCKPQTARPGTSKHEMGNAVDFGNMCYARRNVPTCPGNARWEWLRKNAAIYGFHPLGSEAWHWSTSGT